MKAGAVPSLFALPGKPHGLPRSGFFLFSAIKFNKNMYSSAYGRTEHVFYKEGLIFCWNNRQVYDNGQSIAKLRPEGKRTFSVLRYQDCSCVVQPIVTE